MEAEKIVTYYPLPTTDTEAFAGKALSKALTADGFRMDDAVPGQVINHKTGETLMLLGDEESRATLSDANWDIFRAMDDRAKLVHQSRLFPCEGKFGELFGRFVGKDHPAFVATYELSGGFYAGFYDQESSTKEAIIEAEATEPKEKPSAPLLIADALADIFWWVAP